MADKLRINSKYDIEGNFEPPDSEDDYSEKDKQILSKLRKRKHESESEDDVYRFSGSDDDDSTSKNDLDIADSDIEGQEHSDNDLPNSKAWGKKKKSYYSTDYVDQDYGGFQDDEEDALMEEEEAKNIQKRLIEQLGEDDFSLEFFNTTAEDGKQESAIKSDLRQISKKQKLQIFEKESPEFSGLVEDFKTKLTVVKDDLQPVLDLVKGGKLPKCAASKFVKTNYDVILNYCTNISFYLLLKSQRVNIQNHPVIKRLYQYRQMLNKMEPIYQEVIKPQIDKILNAVKNNLELHKIEEEKVRSKRKLEKPLDISNNAKKLKLVSTLEKDDGADTGVSDDDEVCEGNDFFKRKEDAMAKTNNESEESGFSDNDDAEESESKPTNSLEIIDDEVGDKREITYQIAKNKGLTPYRKKEQRNPRVKHKLKYRKAKIRRKGAIREPRNEMSRYGGETSGIKANVKKSVKIK